MSDAFADFTDKFNGSGLEPGQLIADENYYSMTAKDMSGRMWSSKNIMVNDNTIMFAPAKVLEIKLKSIVYTQKLDRKNTTNNRKYWYCVDRIKKVPFNEFRKGEYNSSLSKCKLKISSYVCEIFRNDKYDEVTGSMPYKRNASDFGKVILQSISIASGSIIRPRMSIVTNLRNTVTTIYSEELKKTIAKIQEPFPCENQVDTINLERFVSNYVLHFKGPNSLMGGYWYRIMTGSGDNFENMALVISTCIEGVLKEYFPRYGFPDDDYLGQVAKARKDLKNIELGKRVRERIMSTLGGKKSFTAKGAFNYEGAFYHLSKVGWSEGKVFGTNGLQSAQNKE